MQGRDRMVFRRSPAATLPLTASRGRLMGGLAPRFTLGSPAPSQSNPQPRLGSSTNGREITIKYVAALGRWLLLRFYVCCCARWVIEWAGSNLSAAFDAMCLTKDLHSKWHIALRRSGSLCGTDHPSLTPPSPRSSMGRFSTPPSNSDPPPSTPP